MKTTVVDGKSYKCPLYVVRVPQGWQVRLPHAPTTLFSDSKHGGVKGSHKAACDARTTAMPIGREMRPFAEVERANKKNPIGVPGIFFFEKKKTNKSKSEYQLQIRVRPFPAKTLYVGTVDTYKERYDERLALAIKIRDALITQLETGKAPSEALAKIIRPPVRKPAKKAAKAVKSAKKAKAKR